MQLPKKFFCSSKVTVISRKDEGNCITIIFTRQFQRLFATNSPNWLFLVYSLELLQVTLSRMELSVHLLLSVHTNTLVALCPHKHTHTAQHRAGTALVAGFVWAGRRMAIVTGLLSAGSEAHARLSAHGVMRDGVAVTQAGFAPSLNFCSIPRASVTPTRP